jgi:hypothetical protein
MPIIDLFNKTADEAKIFASIKDGTFRFGSKQYAKYLLKSAAEGAIIGGVIGLALIGAIVVVAETINPSTPEEETE